MPVNENKLTPRAENLYISIIDYLLPDKFLPKHLFLGLILSAGDKHFVLITWAEQVLEEKWASDEILALENNLLDYARNLLADMTEKKPQRKEKISKYLASIQFIMYIAGALRMIREIRRKEEENATSTRS